MGSSVVRDQRPSVVAYGDASGARLPPELRPRQVAWPMAVRGDQATASNRALTAQGAVARDGQLFGLDVTANSRSEPAHLV